MEQEQGMSWDEAETVARELVRELQAADKIHQACLKARYIDEAIQRHQSDLEKYANEIKAATSHLAEFQAKAAQVEADANTRAAAANNRALTAETTATEIMDRQREALREVQGALAEAKRQSREEIAVMERQAKARAAQLEAEHRTVIAQYLEATVQARTERDQAFAALREVVKSVPIGV